MKLTKFKAEILPGHKGDAVEVPFNPMEAWGMQPRPIWRGRKGYPVSGTLNRVPFEESFIVPRSKKFFLIIDKDMQRAAGVNAGDSVSVSVALKVE
ncbi:MAG TPA: DUF1905 domain-containing protein [Pyrinomonadaceae bacterium]|nr:DUF1905 domain-containing protein [Pyrinomonadaceae bacterium]